MKTPTETDEEAFAKFLRAHNTDASGPHGDHCLEGAWRACLAYARRSAQPTAEDFRALGEAAQRNADNNITLISALTAAEGRIARLKAELRYAQECFEALDGCKSQAEAIAALLMRESV